MNPTSEEQAAFWRRVTKGPSCWIFGGGKWNGHWTFAFNNEPVAGAHVYSYILHYGPVPKGKQVNHTCDNRRCVNPEHLYAGTQLDNSRDAYQRGRARPRGKEPLGFLEILKVMRRREDGESGAAIARSLGMTKEGINRILKGIGLIRFNPIGMDYDSRAHSSLAGAP